MTIQRNFHANFSPELVHFAEKITTFITERERAITICACTAIHASILIASGGTLTAGMLVVYVIKSVVINALMDNVSFLGIKIINSIRGNTLPTMSLNGSLAINPALKIVGLGAKLLASAFWIRKGVPFLETFILFSFSSNYRHNNGFNIGHDTYGVETEPEFTPLPRDINIIKKGIVNFVATLTYDEKITFKLDLNDLLLFAEVGVLAIYEYINESESENHNMFSYPLTSIYHRPNPLEAPKNRALAKLKSDFYHLNEEQQNSLKNKLYSIVSKKENTSPEDLEEVATPVSVKRLLNSINEFNYECLVRGNDTFSQSFSSIFSTETFINAL